MRQGKLARYFSPWGARFEWGDPFTFVEFGSAALFGEANEELRDDRAQSRRRFRRTGATQWGDGDLQVAIRIRDTPLAPPTEAEGHTDVSLESETGMLVVGQLDRGSADEIALPRSGIYEGHAWRQHRQAAADYYKSPHPLSLTAGRSQRGWLSLLMLLSGAAA